MLHILGAGASIDNEPLSTEAGITPAMEAGQQARQKEAGSAAKG